MTREETWWKLVIAPRGSSLKEHTLLRDREVCQYFEMPAKAFVDRTRNLKQFDLEGHRFKRYGAAPKRSEPMTGAGTGFDGDVPPSEDPADDWKRG